MMYFLNFRVAIRCQFSGRCGGHFLEVFDVLPRFFCWEKRHFVRLDSIKFYEFSHANLSSRLRKKGSPKIVRLMAIGGKSAVLQLRVASKSQVLGLFSCEQPDR